MREETMRIKDLTFVAIRLLAIYLFIQASFFLPTSISMVLAPNSQAPEMNAKIVMGGLVSGLVIVIFSGILWSIAGGLTDFMTTGLKENTEPPQELNMQNLYVVAITILGVFIIFSSTPRFFSAIRYLINISANKGDKLEVLDAVGPIVQMIIGFMCAFKTESVVAKLRR